MARWITLVRITGKVASLSYPHYFWALDEHLTWTDWYRVKLIFIFSFLDILHESLRLWWLDDTGRELCSFLATQDISRWEWFFSMTKSSIALYPYDSGSSRVGLTLLPFTMKLRWGQGLPSWETHRNLKTCILKCYS